MGLLILIGLSEARNRDDSGGPAVRATRAMFVIQTIDLAGRDHLHKLRYQLRLGGVSKLADPKYRSTAVSQVAAFLSGTRNCDARFCR
jgi:hypothetical protein